jgi:hypothetical protein
MWEMLEIARKMRGPDGKGRVMVLDVHHSSTKYRIHLGNRATRNAYYIRPPAGVSAHDLKQILDEAGGEAEFEFRYFPYPELETELKPLLSADPYASKNFATNGEYRFLQVDGERPKAREMIHQMLEAFKEPFNPEGFPRIHEFGLVSYSPPVDGRRSELTLRRKDGERDELRKSEPGFHVALAEHGFATEIGVYRPTVSDTEPVLILSTNEHTGALGHAFLADMATYFGSPKYAEQSNEESRAAEQAKQQRIASAPSHVKQMVQPIRVEAPKQDERQLVTNVAKGLKELLPSMKLLKKREVSQSGPNVIIAFPGVLGFGKGPSTQEIKELESVFRALQADPTVGSGWRPYYQVDSKSGDLRIAPSFSPHPPSGWATLGH